MKERFKAIISVHLFLIKENKVLLLRRYNTGWSDGCYSVPAGHLEENETVLEAMIREAKEEAGIVIKSDDLITAHIMNRKCEDDKRVDFFFLAKTWEGEAENIESYKCDDLSWFELNDLPQNMVPYVRKSIENFIDNVIYSEFGWKE